MAKIRFRIRFNEGRTGVPLEKLERIATETRKFLDSIAADLDLPDGIKWVGSHFANESLSYDVEGDRPVAPAQHDDFNAALVALTEGEIPPFVTRESADRFYAIAKRMEPGEHFRIGVYNGALLPHWVDLVQGIIPKETASLHGTISYIGVIQGTIHSWYKGAPSPSFHLRESRTNHLVKCEYRSDSVYDQLAEAVRDKRNVVHAHGEITVDRETRTVQSVRVDKLAWFKPFTMRDVDEYLDSGKIQ
jgi:hypothetical protein